MKKYCDCLQCGEFFELTGASKDMLGWHTACPECGGSFDIDIEDYVVPAGTLVQLPSGEKGVVSDFRDEYAEEMGDILYLVTYRIGHKEHMVRARHSALTIIEDWRKTRRNELGIERVCHYPKNQEWSNVPCYNCVDLTRCNADIYERLAQYEDTGLTRDLVAAYKQFADELVAAGLTFGEVLNLIENHKKEGT